MGDAEINDSRKEAIEREKLGSAIMNNKKVYIFGSSQEAQREVKISDFVNFLPEYEDSKKPWEKVSMGVKFVGIVDEIIINKIKNLIGERGGEFLCYPARCIFENTRDKKDKKDDFLQMRETAVDGYRYIGFMKWYRLPNGKYRVYVIPLQKDASLSWEKLTSMMEVFRKIEGIAQNIEDTFPVNLRLDFSEFKKESEAQELFNVIARRISGGNTNEKIKWLYGKAEKFLKYIYDELKLVQKLDV